MKRFFRECCYFTFLFFSFGGYASGSLDFSELYFKENDPNNYSMVLFDCKKLLKTADEEPNNCPEKIRPFLKKSLKSNQGVCYEDEEPTENITKIIKFIELPDNYEEAYVVSLSTRAPLKSASFIGRLLGDEVTSAFAFSGGLLIFPQSTKEAVIFSFGNAASTLLDPLGIVQNWGRNLVASEIFFDPGQVREISAKYYRKSTPSTRRERSAKVEHINRS